MIDEEFGEKLDRFTLDQVRRKANQLVGRAGFTYQDKEDLEQELIARVLQSLRSFDPRRGHRNAFITTVVERYAKNILRNKQAAKRDYRRVSSINVMINIDGETPVELAHLITQRELDARRRRHPRSDLELAELALDVATAIESLPDDLRGLAERCLTRNVSQVAQDTGIPRTTLQRPVREIRQRFEKMDLKNYI